MNVLSNFHTSKLYIALVSRFGLKIKMIWNKPFIIKFKKSCETRLKSLTQKYMILK